MFENETAELSSLLSNKMLHRHGGNLVILFFNFFFFCALFQTEDHDSMMSWIAAIQANNNPDEDVRVFPCYFILLAYWN